MNDTGCDARIKLPSDSRWFDGHFPGNPVLPGIAQLGMVADLLSWALARRLMVTSVGRVRFKQMLWPGDCIDLSVTPKSGHEGMFAFQITKDGQMVCNGNITVGESTGTSKEDTQ